MPYPPKTSPEAIRRAAVSLLEREGESGLTVRAVASALGVVPNALYHHFAGRDALMAAVAEEGARRILVALRRAAQAAGGGDAATSPDPTETIRAVADAYLRFSRLHPAVYDVVMRRHEALEQDERAPAAHDELWRMLVDTVTLISGVEAAPVASVSLWGFLHGMAGLERARLLGGKKPQDAASFGLTAFLVGLQAMGAPDNIRPV